ELIQLDSLWEILGQFCLQKHGKRPELFSYDQDLPFVERIVHEILESERQDAEFHEQNFPHRTPAGGVVQHHVAHHANNCTASGHPHTSSTQYHHAGMLPRSTNNLKQHQNALPLAQQPLVHEQVQEQQNKLHANSCTHA
ncbi:unnamed protein product, partial [Amoebophrya sp. A120]